MEEGNLEEGNPLPLHTEPPPLPYSLHTRKKAIAFFWILFVVDTLGQPLILYWALWYCTDLSHNLSTLTVDPSTFQWLTCYYRSLLHRHRVLRRYLGI